MKTEDTQPELPNPLGSTDAAAEPPASHSEQELDELRRFRVRTVPPDVRRQWLLAETPVVSSIELSDTIPPERVKVVANHPSERPSDVRSLRAATRKLRSVPPPPGPSQRLVFVTTAIVVGVVVFVVAYVLVGRKPAQRSVPAVPAVPAQTEAFAGPTEKPAEVPAAPSPPAGALPAEAAATHETKPSVVPQKPERARPKDPESASSSSRRLPPVVKPPSGTDIKTPLFGK